MIWKKRNTVVERPSSYDAHCGLLLVQIELVIHAEQNGDIAVAQGENEVSRKIGLSNRCIEPFALSVNNRVQGLGNQMVASWLIATLE